MKTGILFFDDFINHLDQRLQEKLPGLPAQLKMAPVTSKNYLEKGENSSEAKKAAVLILFYPGDEGIYTVLIKRNTYDGVHSGQISLPGGKVEPGDTTLYMTALRELEEEIGIPRNKINVVGELSEIYIPPSAYNVLPVIGYIDYSPVFRPDPAEVTEVIPVDMRLLLNDNVIQNKMITTRNGLSKNVPCFFIEDHIIWGATAMILRELVELISR